MAGRYWFNGQPPKQRKLQRQCFPQSADYFSELDIGQTKINDYWMVFQLLHCTTTLSVHERAVLSSCPVQFLPIPFYTIPFPVYSACPSAVGVEQSLDSGGTQSGGTLHCRPVMSKREDRRIVTGASKSSTMQSVFR